MPAEAAKTSFHPVADLKHANPATTYLDHLGPGSRRAIRQALEAIANLIAKPQRGKNFTAEQFRWEKTSAGDVATLRQHLIEHFAPATVNKMLSALRGVLRASRDLGLMTEAAFQSTATFANLPDNWQPPEVHVLTAVQVRTLFRSCASDSLGGLRDAALLTVFLASGLRRSEAVALNVEDFDPATGALRIPSPEPRKCRVVYLRKPAVQRLAAWIAAADRDPGPERPLIAAVNKGGRVQHRRLTDQAIYNMIRRIGSDSGQPMLTSRALRLTYVVTLIARGLSPAHVQALAGHASWLTISAYTQLADRVLQHQKQLPDLLMDIRKTLRAMGSLEQSSLTLLPEEKGNR